MQFHTAYAQCAQSPRRIFTHKTSPQLFRSHTWLALTRQQSEQGSYTAAPLVFSPRHLLHTAYLVAYTPKRSTQSLFVSQSGCCVILVLLTCPCSWSKADVLVLVYISRPAISISGLG